MDFIEDNHEASTCGSNLDRQLALHEILDKNDIEELHRIFLKANTHRFSEDQLREVLSKFGVTYADEDFHILFLKVY